MLVLTRKPNQSIMIGDDVEVSVLSVVGEKVRIGIHAPHDIPVFRTEIYVEIQREQSETGHGSSEAILAPRWTTRWTSSGDDLAAQLSSRYSVRNITTVTIAAVSISVSTSSTKRTDPRL